MTRSLAVLAVLCFGALTPSAIGQTPDLQGGISDLTDLTDPLVRARILKEAAITRAKLAARINFDGIANPKTTLSDALDLVQRRSSIPLDINNCAFVDDGVSDVLSRPIGKVIPKMRGVSTSTVLCSILGRIPSRSGITFFPRNGTVEISTVRAYRYQLRLTGAILRPCPPIVPGGKR